MNNNKKPAAYDQLSQEAKAVSIPYYVHEGEMTRMDRINKRWFAAFMIVLVMLFVTNIGWIIYESQFEEVTVTQDVQTGEGAAVVSGAGNVSYGDSTSGD